MKTKKPTETCENCGGLIACSFCICDNFDGAIASECIPKAELSALKARCAELEQGIAQALVYLKTENPGNTFRLMCINGLEDLRNRATYNFSKKTCKPNR